MNAADYLLGEVGCDGRIALITPGGDHSYENIHEGAWRVKRLLKAAGLKKGDRVVLVEQSSLFWVQAYLGTMAAGCVSVPVPFRSSPDSFREILKISGAAGVIMGKGITPDYRKTLPVTIPLFTEEALGSSKESAGSLVTDEVDDVKDLAALLFTSGSTGTPRGVMITHRNIMANTDSIVRYMELTSEDRVMAFLPFYYCFGTSLLHTHLRVGGSIVVENSFLFPNKVLQRMIETRCTGTAGVPSNYQILLRSSSLKKMSFPDLRYVQQAGGKLDDFLIEELRHALPGTKVYVMYGQTEATARLSYLPPELLDAKSGSIGKGMPGVKLEVLDSSGVPVKAGEVGEIVARGDNIALGYWNDPEGTAATFRGGRLFTGDLATVDEDGFIYVVDRAKDFLKVGGNRVGCRRIEETVLRFPGTVEAGVIPQPDDRLGEAVRLYVVHARGEAAREDLIAFCGSNLPWDQVPRTIVFLRHMPKNASGKMDKQALKAMLSEEDSRQDVKTPRKEHLQG